MNDLSHESHGSSFEIPIDCARIGGEVPKRGIHVDPPAPWQFQPAVIHENPHIMDIPWILYGGFSICLFMESNDCVY